MPANTTTHEPFMGPPTRSPAWRWDRVQDLLSSSASSPDDDPWITRAIRHFSADSSGPFAHRTGIAKLDPAIRQAHKLHCDNSKPKRRWFLEALLLTPEYLDQIATRCGLSTTAVEAYAALFFEVRSNPEAKDWLLAQAVRCGPHNNFVGAELGGVWRYMAYVRGVPGLEAAMAATGDAPWPSWLSQSKDDSQSQAADRVKLRTVLTIRLMFAYSKYEIKLIKELNDQLRRLGNQPDHIADNDSPFNRYCDQLIAKALATRRKRRKSVITGKQDSQFSKSDGLELESTRPVR